MLQEAYGSRVRIFANSIPVSVRAAEISAEGVSIYQHDPKGKVATAYQSLTEEVITSARHRDSHFASQSKEVKGNE
jgi:chromosome partitioning protein